MTGWVEHEDLSGLYLLFADECTCLPDSKARYVGETGRGLARHDGDDRLAKLWHQAVRTIRVLPLPGATKDERLAAESEFMLKHPTPWNIQGNPGGCDWAQVRADVAAAQEQAELATASTTSERFLVRLEHAPGRLALAGRAVVRGLESLVWQSQVVLWWTVAFRLGLAIVNSSGV